MKHIGSIVLAGMLCMLASPAWAHAMLERAAPAPGATVHGAPHELRLSFTDDLELGHCVVALSDAAGRPLQLGPLSLASDDVTLVAPVRAPLAAGLYHVRWQATSIDGHVTLGDFMFRVGG